MRTQESTDDWTVPSTMDPSITDTESFVHLPPPIAPPQPMNDVLKLSFTSKHESVGSKSKTSWTSACVTIEACDMPEEERTSSVDICVALDVSGSMADSNKLRDCKSTLEAMLRPLGAKDRFGLITFGSCCDVVFPALLMTQDNKAAALKKIKALKTNGRTNLSGGLSLAWQELLLANNPNPVRSLFLLTDGQANEGITSTPELVEMVQSFNADSPSDIASALNQNQASVVDTRIPVQRLCGTPSPYRDPPIPKPRPQMDSIGLFDDRGRVITNQPNTTPKSKGVMGTIFDKLKKKKEPPVSSTVGPPTGLPGGLSFDDRGRVMTNQHDTTPKSKGVMGTAPPPIQNPRPQNIPRTIHLTSKGGPVSLFCFGYGSDHNSEMLEAISEATPGGGYYFVENDSDVFTAFGDAMGGIMSVMAQSAVLKISVPPAAVEAGVKIREVHHDKKVDRGDGSFTVNLGDFYAEERRDVVVDFDLANVTSNEPVLHLISTLSYMNVVTKKSTTGGPRDCSISRPDSAELSAVNKEVEAQCFRVQVVREMEEADREARNNNRAQAEARLRRMQATIQTSPAYGTGDAFYSSLQQNVTMAMEDYAEAARTMSYKGHRSKNATQVLRTQRACASRPAASPSGDYYSTKSKQKMAKAFQMRSSPSSG